MSFALRFAGFILVSVITAGSISAAQKIDNSSLAPPAFRKHVATYGVVYLLPKDVTGILDAKITAPLKEQLVKNGLVTETKVSNIPHVTVMHLHSADRSTPAKMLKAMPKLPGPLSVTLKTFYTTEAAKGAGHPWWFDLGIVKTGDGFENMMAFNTRATAALTPLRDGPLPRVTGPVYAVMSEAGRELVKTVGVSGVNVMKDGKEVRAHNPHNTLVYSMAKFAPPVQAAFNQVAEDFNTVLPDGIATTFKDVSIVEIGFAGNVLREIYRIDLASGAVTDIKSGKALASIGK